MIPETLLVLKLLTLFSADQIGPASQAVYHDDETQPTTPFVLYRRTGTDYERDLGSNSNARVVTFEVSVSSIFFSQAAVTMPDNWTDTSTATTWYFTLESQDQDTSNYQLNFTYSAAAAM